MPPVLPLDLYLVRHGHAEGNRAHREARLGNPGRFTPAFRQRHSATWRVVPSDHPRIARAAQWLARELAERGHHGVYGAVSPYARALDTAALLSSPAAGGPVLGRARWHVHHELRERSWGVLETLTYAEREHEHAARLAQRPSAPFFWEPPGGEPLAAVVDRVARFLEAVRALNAPCPDAHADDHAANTAHAYPTTRAVVAVCHGETMTALRVLLDPAWSVRVVRPDWLEDPRILVGHADVVHYTRRDPGDPATVLEMFGWVRHVAAGDEATPRPERQEWTDLRWGAAAGLDARALRALADAQAPHPGD